MSAPEDGQEHTVSMRTAVCLVPVPTGESAAFLCLVVATNALVVQATKVLAVSMTQMNVKIPRLYARTRARVSTNPAPTSVTVPQGLQVNTVKALISLAPLHHA